MNASLRISSLLIFCIYSASVCSDMYLLRDYPGLKDLLLVSTFGLMVIASLYSLSVVSLPGKGFVSRNRLFFVYAAGILIIELLAHNQSSSMILRLLVYLASGFMGYVFLPTWWGSERRLLDALMVVVAVISTVLAGSAILSNLGFNGFLGLPFSDKFGQYEVLGMHATGGLIDHPNTLGAQMLFGIGCSYYLQRRLYRITGSVCLAICSAGLLLSMGRAAWLAAMVSGYFFVTRKYSDKRATLVTIVIPLALIGLGIVSLSLIPPESKMGTLLRLEASLSGREILWPLAISAIARQPLVGYGFLSSPDVKWQFGTDITRRYAADASFHNNFLDMAVQSGVIIAALYLLLFLVPIWRIVKKTGESAYRNAMLLMIAAPVIVGSFSNYNIGGLRSVSLSMALFLGLANNAALLSSGDEDGNLEEQRTVPENQSENNEV